MQFDMVFEGGGAKGMVFVGALKALEAHGHTSGRLIGTSAGAITATLLAVGYDAAKMARELGKKDPSGKAVFAQFMDEPEFADVQEEIDTSVAMKLLKDINVPIIPDFVEQKADRQVLEGLLKLSA